MFAHEPESVCGHNFNCRIENDGHLKVVGNDYTGTGIGYRPIPAPIPIRYCDCPSRLGMSVSETLKLCCMSHHKAQPDGVVQKEDGAREHAVWPQH